MIFNLVTFFAILATASGTIYLNVAKWTLPFDWKSKLIYNSNPRVTKTFVPSPTYTSELLTMSSNLRPMTISIDGLDGSGKSTAAKRLVQSFDAGIYLRTPPEEMRSFRQVYDEKGGVERETYYMIGNYVAGNKMRELRSAGSTVIIDRYYCSTKAYIVGNRLDSEIPAVGDRFYEWPVDLYKPDMMILLTVNETERLRRRMGRTEVPETKEEAALRENPLISERINEAYRRFGCIEVDASGTCEEIVARLRETIVDYARNSADTNTTDGNES